MRGVKALRPRLPSTINNSKHDPRGELQGTITTRSNIEKRNVIRCWTKLKARPNIRGEGTIVGSQLRTKWAYDTLSRCTKNKSHDGRHGEGLTCTAPQIAMKPMCHFYLQTPRRVKSKVEVRGAHRELHTLLLTSCFRSQGGGTWAQSVGRGSPLLDLPFGRTQ